MKIDSAFEKKLEKCIEKYGRIKGDNVVKKIAKKFNWRKAKEPTDMYGMIDEEEDNSKYYFNHKISVEPSPFGNMFNNKEEDPLEANRSKKMKTDVTIEIRFHDNDMVESLSDILNNGSMYSSSPSIELYDLYHCINDMRIKMNDDGKNVEHVRRVIFFLEELFEDEISAMEEMISRGVINYESLWYYFDKVRTIYSVKFHDFRICYEHSHFHYTTKNMGGGSVPIFRLGGHITYVNEKELCKADFSYDIKKFTNKRKLESFDVRVATDDDREKHISYANKLLNIIDKPHHMHLDGKQYAVRSDGHGIATIVKNEKVMVDEDGIHKYGEKPFDYEVIDSINKDEMTDIERVIMFPFASLFNLGIHKTWGVAHITNLHEVTYSKGPFDNLVMDKEKKRIIETLVKNHDSSQNIDIIENKGRGLIFLLYGPPGVGKTLTSEAIADYIERPLYCINICDLGTNPDVVEMEMETIIDYARRWNAIVMLDEADIFVETRETSNIMRNAMVGTFLKFLEYNENIMFLTTNRIMEIDPAVKSRMNMLLAYNDLGMKERKKVWKVLLKKNNIELDKDVIERLSAKEINGREIRNYVRIIVSMLKEKDKSLDDVYEIFDECYGLSTEFESNMRKPSMYT